LHDTVQLDDEALPPGSAPLLQAVMRGGRRLAPSPSLDAVRAHHAAQMRTLPQSLRGLEPADQPFTAEISARLQALARELDAAPH
jgi:nicotinate phosphoribosyltransferase